MFNKSFSLNKILYHLCRGKYEVYSEVAEVFSSAIFERRLLNTDVKTSRKICLSGASILTELNRFTLYSNHSRALYIFVPLYSLFLNILYYFALH